MSVYKYLLGCCKSVENVVEHPIQDAVNRPITSESVFCMIGQIEGNAIDIASDAAKPVINSVVQPIIGTEISGNIDTVVKTVIKPAIVHSS